MFRAEPGIGVVFNIFGFESLRVPNCKGKYLLNLKLGSM